jgi:peptide chain release factor subunit 1
MIGTADGRATGAARDRLTHVRAAVALRQLAAMEPGEAPFLSAYLDLRPSPDAARPAIREARIVVRDHLRSSLDSLPAHGPAHDSIRADGERLVAVVDDLAGERERGIAFIGCRAADLSFELRTWVPFETRVEVRPRPVLLPLARHADHSTTVVALADTNSLRLFVSQPGRLVELPAVDDEPDDYTRTEAGGWSQARYQRHVDEHRDQFARRAAGVTERAISRFAGDALLLAGDEVAIPRLRQALSGPAAEAVRGVLRLELRSALDEIEVKALPEIDRVRDDDARETADRLADAVGAGGMGTAGVKRVHRALAQGQGLELLLDPDPTGPLHESDAEELISTALTTATGVRFVTGHDALRDLGGVGLLLRYRT